LAGRYQPGTRPVLWDERFPGVDRVITTSGETIDLLSEGGQSSPAPGWELLLTEELAGQGSRWTLYGISRAAQVGQS
jgi:hypothetical protein